jgi:prevent-host-death family protein
VGPAVVVVVADGVQPALGGAASRSIKSSSSVDPLPSYQGPGATVLHMDRVGIRELRLNASQLMARVERGESLEVTSRGRLVARIVPVRPSGGLAQLLAEGAATGPEEEGDLLDIPAVEPAPGAPLPSQVLAELRADER